MQNSSNPASIQVGDHFPAFEGPAPDGRMINLDGDALAGRPRLLALLRDPNDPAAVEALLRIAAWAERLQGLDVRVFAVVPLRPSLANAMAEALKLPFPVICDPDMELARRLTPALLPLDGPPLISILLRPNRQVQAVLAAEVEDHGDVACAHVETLHNDRAHRVHIGMQAPVLLVPDVFSREDCQHLMTVFAMQGQEYLDPSHGSQGRTQDYKMRIPDYGRDDRIDHWVINDATTRFITERLFPRVGPEVMKAFHYRLTKHERYRIGRYQALGSGEATQGAAHGHRDNTEPQVAHRRFACSVALNAEAHEGGGLVFPEYSGVEYAPRTGEALIFSSSLLHQVMPVTKGTRFVLLSFLFGDT